MKRPIRNRPDPLLEIFERVERNPRETTHDTIATILGSRLPWLGR
ncbi:MAG: hypothetical protein ABIW19_06250 [Vicinamibacterales bacterium]